MATWWDLAQELDVLICDGISAGCRKKWRATSHKIGKVDAIGVIHWDRWNRRAGRIGLRRFLKMVALAKNRPYRNEPSWLRLYHSSLWAHHEGIRRFHVRFTWEESLRDRHEVRRLAKRAKVNLRNDHPKVHEWAWRVPRRHRRMRRPRR